MNSPCRFLLPFLFSYYLVIFSATFEAEAIVKKLPRPFNNSISSAYIFGDSTVDPGNNNYIGTIFKSNFPPYGQDFLNHIPTGRFTNGRLITDFLAEYVGIKETVPAYLDPTLGIEELISGVSFASATTGFDPLTAQIASVITIQQQLNYFREYKARVIQAIGEKEAKLLINKAAFVISCGTNDYGITYFNTPLRKFSYTISDYQQFLLENVQNLLQGLIDEGAQIIAVAGLPPLGCLPIFITIDSGNAGHNRNCIEKYSSAARSFNEELQKVLSTLQRPNVKIVYADIYNPLEDMIKNPRKYGFSNNNTGCCGTGKIKVSYLRNPMLIVCPNASNYIFWDSVHPTEAAYYNLFKALRPLVDSIIKE